MSGRAIPAAARWRGGAVLRMATTVAVAATMLPAAAEGPATPSRAAAPLAARNVILFVGDGLGPSATTAARWMRYKEEGALAMDTMPSVARVRTRSLDASTADGAAAASALLTGVRPRNDVVALDADARSVGFAPGRDPIRNVAGAENRCPASGNGKPVSTLLELAVAKGRATGIVTTARLTSGPAAASFAHICHRDAEYDVARQVVPGGPGYNGRLGRGLDVLFGGGSGYWRPYDATRRPRGRPDARELVGELQAQGYTFVNDLTTLNAAPLEPGTRLIGLFDLGDPDGAALAPMSFDLDRDPKREPSLAEMTAKAIDVLATNANGYVLVVEGGRIGQALAAGSVRRALVDTIAFDDAVRAALDKVDLNRTLVVVTGDHDQTLTLIGGSRRGADPLGLHLNPVTGKPDVDAAGATYPIAVLGTGPVRPDQRRTLDTPTVVQKDYVAEAAIRLATGSGGGGDVWLHAAGAGSTKLRGTLDAIGVLPLIRDAAGL